MVYELVNGRGIKFYMSNIIIIKTQIIRYVQNLKRGPDKNKNGFWRSLIKFMFFLQFPSQIGSGKICGTNIFYLSCIYFILCYACLNTFIIERE